MEAAAAHFARVSIELGGKSPAIVFEDGDGIGVTVINTPPTRFSVSLPGSQQGLVGLRERAEILHGTLESGPTAEGGYRVRLRIPLSAD